MAGSRNKEENCATLHARPLQEDGGLEVAGRNLLLHGSAASAVPLPSVEGRILEIQGFDTSG